MSRKLRVHLALPADKAPAPHMVSGSKDTPVGPLGSGRANVAACDPTVVFSEWDNATGEWWAVACQACVQTEAFQAAARATPHPRAGGRPDEAEDVSEAIKGCCG